MKIKFVFIMILSCLATFAQEQYKPVKGSFTTELQFSPFNININIDVNNENFGLSTGPFTMPALRLRYFFSNKLALRTSLNLNFDNDKAVINLDYTEYSYNNNNLKFVRTGELTVKNSFNTFSIAPGLEYHFGDWERMSLYIGGELFFGITTSKTTVDEETEAMIYIRDYWNGNYEDYSFYGSNTTTITIEMKNCSERYYDKYPYYDYYYFSQNAPKTFGVNAVFGMDLYIYKGLYMGAEFGLGYTFKTYLNGSYKGDIVSVTTPVNGTPDIQKTETDEKFEDKITSGNLNFRYNPMIRFGWRF
jgi:hypothetical protein